MYKIKHAHMDYIYTLLWCNFRYIPPRVDVKTYSNLSSKYAFSASFYCRIYYICYRMWSLITTFIAYPRKYDWLIVKCLILIWSKWTNCSNKPLWKSYKDQMRNKMLGFDLLLLQDNVLHLTLNMPIQTDKVIRKRP